MSKRPRKQPRRRERPAPQGDLFGCAPSPPFKAGHKAKAPQASPQDGRSNGSAKPAAPGALLNVRQAATRLGLSKSTLDKMRCAGKGPRFIKSTDRAVRYDPADLDGWIAARRQAPTDDIP